MAVLVSPFPCFSWFLRFHPPVGAEVAAGTADWTGQLGTCLPCDGAGDHGPCFAPWRPRASDVGRRIQERWNSRDLNYLGEPCAC